MEREELAKKKKEIRLEQKNVTRKKEAIVTKKQAVTKKHITRSSSSTSMSNSSSYTSNSVMQPAVFPSVSCSVSSVIHQLGSSLPCTSNDPESDGQANSSQEPDLDADYCECSFCYEPFCKDGKE